MEKLSNKWKLKEAFSLRDLDHHAISDLTAKWLYDRINNGFNSFTLVNLDINPQYMLLTFKAHPTYEIGSPVTIVDPKSGHERLERGYTTQLQFMNPKDALGSSKDFQSFTEGERAQLLADYINNGLARTHCNCGAYAYQGHWEAMASHDSDIYTFKLPHGTGVWSSRHAPGLTEVDIRICKHIAAVIEQMQDFQKDILSALESKSW